MSVIYMLFLDANILTYETHLDWYNQSAVWYSAGLFCFNVALMGMLARAALEGIRKLTKLIEDLKGLNAQLKQDKREDREKFGTPCLHRTRVHVDGRACTHPLTQLTDPTIRFHSHCLD